MRWGRLVGCMVGCFIGFAVQASEPIAGKPSKSAPLTAPYDPLSADVQNEALAWVKRNAHPLDVPADDPCTKPLLDPATLKPMTAALAKARVIGIGEVSHGDCESFAFKASLIRALVLYDGVTVIGMEATIEGGRQLDAFIAPGQPVLTGEALVTETDKALLDANIFGIWKTAALRDLLAWLRVYNQTASNPVHFANFDTQSPFADSQFAARFLANSLARPEYKSARYNSLRQRLTEITKVLSPLLTLPTTTNRFEGYLTKQDKASFGTHRAAADLLFALFAETPPELHQTPDFGVAEQSAFAFATWMELSADGVGSSQDEIISDASVSSPPIASFSVRDRGMAASVLRILRDHPNSKMALWAHNVHVSRSGFLSNDINALSMGQNLNATMATNYAVVAFVTSQGNYNPIVVIDENGKSKAADTFPLPSNPYSLGAFFAKLKEQHFWLDLRSLPYAVPWELAWRNYPYIVQEGGYAPTQADIYNPYIRPIGFNSDITVFFDTIHPTVRIAAPKATP